MTKRSEDSYIHHDIIPLLMRLGYPGAGEHERVKIKEVPIYRPSGGRSSSLIDLVYYHGGEPVLLVEAKSEHRSHEKALEEAENYIRNFPIKDNRFAPSGRPPRYIATTRGKEIRFYHHRFEVSDDGLLNQISDPIPILSFDELLEKYGYVKGYKPKKLDPESFRKDFLHELVAAYNTADDGKITPEVIKNVAWHILNYLQNQKAYVNRYPYTELDKEFFRQEHIKDVHRRFDLIASLGPDLAQQFRSFILRAFQGTALNQYLTEQCVIAFMADLVGPVEPTAKVLDFECGSGGFLAAAAKRGVPLENMLGIDIDELPFIVAKTYLALYFGITGKKIDSIPIKHNNGLFYWGNNWDLVLGNPAGSFKYNKDDLEKVLENLERDIDRNGKDDKFSEYNFSIQQAVRSCKVGGKICLVLPDGFFSNAEDEYLRKYIAKHCKVLAIVSLPRGVFKKGTTTKSITSGKQPTTMKMSILYAEKVKPVSDNEGIDVDAATLNYPVFVANIASSGSMIGDICHWLEPRLNMVLEEWKAWQAKRQLAIVDESLIKDAEKAGQEQKSKKSTVKRDERQIDLQLGETAESKKLKETKSVVTISTELDKLFKKK